jgi:hypothetical protein
MDPAAIEQALARAERHDRILARQKKLIEKMIATP